MTHTWDDIKKKFGDDGIYFIESSNREIYPDDPHKLADQNHTDGIYDFRSPEENWQWLKELGPDYEWLYTRDKIEKVYDVSDSGMLWFLITGGVDRKKNTKIGCETCGWKELKFFFNDQAALYAFHNFRILKENKNLSVPTEAGLDINRNII